MEMVLLPARPAACAALRGGRATWRGASPCSALRGVGAPCPESQRATEEVRGQSVLQRQPWGLMQAGPLLCYPAARIGSPDLRSPPRESTSQPCTLPEGSTSRTQTTVAFPTTAARPHNLLLPKVHGLLTSGRCKGFSRSPGGGGSALESSTKHTSRDRAAQRGSACEECSFRDGIHSSQPTTAAAAG